MPKFRKKPVVIEANQWHAHGDHEAVIPLPIETIIEKTSKYKHEELGWVPTLEGGHIVTPGDWIITGVEGENYPCKPNIFLKTYEPAE